MIIVHALCYFVYKNKMFEAEVNNERTILDYLNEDCWRIVLNYVPLVNIITSERVCRQWQKAMLSYLHGIRFNITFEEDSDNNHHPNAYSIKLLKYRYTSFLSWTNKLGPSVVATYCLDQEGLKLIRTNCPNLEALTLLHMSMRKANQNKINMDNLNGDLKCLKKLCFYACPISDDSVKQFVADKPLEELEFYDCDEVTGQCFHTIKPTNLKSLVFSSCQSLETQEVLSFINQLSKLTNLYLYDVPQELSREIQLALNKMPNLERLKICGRGGTTNQPYLLSSEPLMQLTSLRHLSTDLKVTDDVVEVITRSCKQLQTLDLANCELLGSRAIEAICCNSGTHITELGLQNFGYLVDDDVVALVRGCPELTLLTLGGTYQLTPALPPRAAAARHQLRPGRCLRLDVIDTNLCDPYYLESVQEEFGEIQDAYDDLILELN